MKTPWPLSINTFLLSNLYGLVFRRWLTLAARLIRLYIATASPTDQLMQVVEYLMGHYIPMWFHIRLNSICSSGAKNLMRSVELLQRLPHLLQKDIRPVMQRNAYWAHTEAVLLVMVAVEELEVRAHIVQVIQQCRQQPHQAVRPFVLPTIKFSADG